MMIKNLIKKLKSILNGDTPYVEEKQATILQACFILMRFFRILPNPGQKFTIKRFIQFCIIMFPITAPLAIGDIIWTYIKHSNGSNYVLDDILQDFSVVGTGLNLYCTLAIIMYKAPLIAILEQELGNFRTFRKPRNFDAADRWSNFVTTFLFVYTFGGVLCFAFISYIRRDACLKESEELGIDRICGTISPASLPMYFNEGYYFYLFAGAQLFNCAVVCEAAVITLSFLYGVIQLFVSRIRLLKTELRLTFDITDTEMRKAHLKYCIKYHVYLIDLTRQLNVCMSTITFIQATFTAIIIAVIAFQMLMRPELKTALHGIGWLCVLWMLCYAGQELINESSDIPLHIYSSDWFEGDLDAMKNVLMIIGRGNHSLFIDNLGFGELGLNTFAAAIQNSYSVVTLLHQSQSD